jgi:hypothetical protein
MQSEGTTLETEKGGALKSKTKGTSRGKKRVKAEDPLVEVRTSHLKVLEGIIVEQKLRVLLYQQVISKASEELGVDILKKVGSQRSGP